MADEKRYCPECGLEMTGVDANAHALSHWPDYLDPARSSRLSRKYQELTRGGGVSKEEYDRLHAEEV